MRLAPLRCLAVPQQAVLFQFSLWHTRLQHRKDAFACAIPWQPPMPPLGNYAMPSLGSKMVSLLGPVLPPMPPLGNYSMPSLDSGMVTLLGNALPGLPLVSPPGNSSIPFLDSRMVTLLGYAFHGLPLDTFPRQ